MGLERGKHPFSGPQVSFHRISRQREASLFRHKKESYFPWQGWLSVIWGFKANSFIWIQSDVPIPRFRVLSSANQCPICVMRHFLRL